MKPKKRQKLCHHCEAEVDLDVIVCPCCAADLREEKPEQQQRPPQVRPVGRPDTEHSLYPSPRVAEAVKEPERVIHGLPSVSVEEAEAPMEKSPWLNMALCTLGAQLLVVGLMMALFSEGGELVLRWKAKWWLMYLLGAGPCLFFGLRGLRG